MVAELSEVFIDEKTGKKSIGIAINSTGDDDWVYYTFGMDMMDGLNITVSKANRLAGIFMNIVIPHLTEIPTVSSPLDSKSTT